MAAGLTELLLTNGQKISIYTDVSPINVPLHVNMLGAGVATSPINFSVQSNCQIKDQITTTTTSGEVEVYANGQKTGKSISTDQRFLISQDRKKWIPRFGFRAGVMYQFKPTVVTS